ncbi:hypothetical protein FACS1894184_02080 [Clostridia bacterium]|nr:hypothetical protein FACS1894184_02080 [Clostridia bacterium]
MKRFLAGFVSIIGLLAALVGAAARFLPVEQIVSVVPWLEFITRVLILEPYWLYILVGGGVLFAGFGVWYILQRRAETRELEAASAAPAPLNQQGQMYQADNADIRARVRDLLRRSWGGPLLALILGILPVALIHTGVHVILRPFQTLWSSVSAVMTGFFDTYGGLMPSVALIAVGSQQPDFTAVIPDALSAAPWIALLIAAWVFVFQPIRVSRAGYFQQLLYGKKPSPLTTLNCFKEKYLRAVGGMAYGALWLTIWGLLAIVIPSGIYIGGVTVVNLYPEELNQYTMWLIPSLVGLSVVSFVALAWRFVDRWLAYSFVPCVLSSQRALPARRAMRASRYLTRGYKTRLLGMWLSFLYYFLPTLIAAALMPLIGPLGNVFGFTEYLSVTLRRFFLIVMLANQLLWLYVGPLAWASFYAFYLEMKREYRDNHPTRLYILGILPKEPMPYKQDDKPRESIDTVMPLPRRRSVELAEREQDRTDDAVDTHEPQPPTLEKDA